MLGDFVCMTATDITSIQRGIVFLLAPWSGPAHSAQRFLVSFLERHDIHADELHVLDVDAHPELYDVPDLVGKIHGWGEALVVKDGRIAFFTPLAKDLRTIQERCDELLRFYVA